MVACSFWVARVITRRKSSEFNWPEVHLKEKPIPWAVCHMINDILTYLARAILGNIGPRSFLYRPRDARSVAGAARMRQTFLSKTFTNSLNMQKQYEKNVWETSNDTYSLSIRVQTTINHISICLLPQYQRQRKCFFFYQSASWKRHCVTHWREQRGMDSKRLLLFQCHNVML